MLLLLGFKPGVCGIEGEPLEATTGVGISTSSNKRSVIRTSPLSVGRGPRAGNVRIFTGHKTGIAHPTASRLGWPRPWILPSRLTLKGGTEITLADIGTVTAPGRTRRSNANSIHPFPKKRPGSRYF